MDLDDHMRDRGGYIIMHPADSPFKITHPVPVSLLFQDHQGEARAQLPHNPVVGSRAGTHIDIITLDAEHFCLGSASK